MRRTDVFTDIAAEVLPTCRNGRLMELLETPVGFKYIGEIARNAPALRNILRSYCRRMPCDHLIVFSERKIISPLTAGASIVSRATLTGSLNLRGPALPGLTKSTP